MNRFDLETTDFKVARKMLMTYLRGVDSTLELKAGRNSAFVFIDYPWGLSDTFLLERKGKMIIALFISNYETEK